jgi:hypothetical protein
VNVLFGGESQPDGRLGDGRLFVGEQILLAIFPRLCRRLFDVGDEGLARFQCLSRVDRDHLGIGCLDDSC